MFEFHGSHMLSHRLCWLDVLLETHISMCDLEHTCGQEIGTMDPSKLLKSLQPHWYAPWASYMRNVPSAQLFTFDA